jgi:hypothetical protein
VHRGPTARCRATGCCHRAPSLPREWPRPRVKLRRRDVPLQHRNRIRHWPHHQASPPVVLLSGCHLLEDYTVTLLLPGLGAGRPDPIPRHHRCDSPPESRPRRELHTVSPFLREPLQLVHRLTVALWPPSPPVLTAGTPATSRPPSLSTHDQSSPASSVFHHGLPAQGAQYPFLFSFAFI